MQISFSAWRLILLVIAFITLSSPSISPLLHAQLPPAPLPPTHLRGHQAADEFAAQTDWINSIAWAPPQSGTTPVSYSIFRNASLTKLAASIPANAKLKFRDHNRKKHTIYNYFLVSVDAFGQQSEPIGIRFIGSKTKLIKTPLPHQLVSLEVLPINPSVPVGFKEQFRAVGVFEDRSIEDLTQRVTWSSSHPTVASISNRRAHKGIARAWTPGKSKIQASLHGISTSTILTVTSARLVAIEVLPRNPTLSIGVQEQFTAIGLFSDGSTHNITKSVTWFSSDPSIASISNALGSQGLATCLVQGSTTITATFGAIAGSTSLTVQTLMIKFLHRNFGPLAGGNTIDIVGIGFTGATHVNFGSTPATSFTVVNDTLITAMVPPGALSTVQVSVNVGSETTPASTNPYYAYQGSWTVYVVSANGNNVTPINVATDTAGANIPIPPSSFPPTIAIAPDGKTAYVCINSTDQVIPIALSSNTPGTPINLNHPPITIAITPDGTKAYVTSYGDSLLIPITLEDQLPGTPIPVNLPIKTAITPDGTTAYVTMGNSHSMLPIALATETPQSPVFVGNAPFGIAITPDATKAYVCITSTDKVAAILLANQQIEAEIPIGDDIGTSIAINPNGTTAYVPNGATNVAPGLVTPIILTSNTAQSPIPFPTFAGTIAITPDGLKGYVTQPIDGLVIPVTLATQTLGPPIFVSGQPEGISITPDPAPIAVFTASVASAESLNSFYFDASHSVSSVGTVVNYAWDFGDGYTLSTATPLINHTYGVSGSYSVTLTVTNSAGTSTTQVFTGQMVSRNGGPSATMKQTLIVN